MSRSLSSTASTSTSPSPSPSTSSPSSSSSSPITPFLVGVLSTTAVFTGGYACSQLYRRWKTNKTSMKTAGSCCGGKISANTSSSTAATPPAPPAAAANITNASTAASTTTNQPTTDTTFSRSPKPKRLSQAHIPTLHPDVPLKPILIVGSINADTFIDLDRLPAPGETIQSRPSSGSVLPGGKGANQAVGVARLLDPGVLSAHIACRIGSDPHGDMLLKVLQQEITLDTELAERVDGPTGQAFILLQPKGENSIILVAGANHNWPDPLPPSLHTAILNSSAILLQREIPHRINYTVAQVAHSHNIPVYLDMGGEDTPLSHDILPYLAIIAPNETELSRLTGMNTDTETGVINAARQLINQGVGRVLVTLGSRGAILISSKGILTCPAFPVEKSRIIDTTGAGDVFRAAFICADVSGYDEPSALRYASAASALCIQKRGAMPSIPTRMDTLTYIQHVTASQR